VRFPSTFGSSPDNALIPRVLEIKIEIIIMNTKKFKKTKTKIMMGGGISFSNNIQMGSQVLHASQISNECRERSCQVILTQIPVRKWRKLKHDNLGI